MNFIDGIKRFFQKLFAKPEKEFAPSEFVEQQKRSLRNLRQTMTELIFQRKKLEAKMKALQTENAQLQIDAEAAAMQDRDELAMHILAQLDEIKSEMEDSQSQYSVVCSEIQQAKEMEKELEKQLEKSQSQIAILMSRMESVKVREKLQGEFSRLQKEVLGMRPGFNQIESNILRLEAKLESMQGREPKMDNELRKLRKDRDQYKRVSQLESLKSQLRRRALPAKVLVSTTERLS